MIKMNLKFPDKGVKNALKERLKRKKIMKCVYSKFIIGKVEDDSTLLK
jgi:hypothetical protein